MMIQIDSHCNFWNGNGSRNQQPEDVPVSFKQCSHDAMLGVTPRRFVAGIVCFLFQGGYEPVRIESTQISWLAKALLKPSYCMEPCGTHLNPSSVGNVRSQVIH